jgi:sugar phosphate isomerase/epimerase
MRLRLGADTLCWHLRIEHAGLPVERAFEEALEAGAEYVQLNLHHVRALDGEGLQRLAERARTLGLELLASGDFVGSATHGATVEDGAQRVRGWLDGAQAIGSPVLRLASGFYRAELAGRPDLIEAERRHVAAVLRATAPLARERGIALLLENHSDFTSAEYRALLADAGDPDVGIFIDLVNPISALEDPLPVVTALAPLARAGHVKDYRLASAWVRGRYHRRGFDVRWCYPGEGALDLRGVLGALLRAHPDTPFPLSVEGLDNRADVADQVVRLRASFERLRDLADEALDASP